MVWSSQPFRVSMLMSDQQQQQLLVLADTQYISGSSTPGTQSFELEVILVLAGGAPLFVIISYKY